MFEALFTDFKVNHLSYNDEPNFKDSKIKGVLKASIARVENYLGRAVILREINSFVQFNGGYAHLSPVPNGGEVIVNGVLNYTDEYGELALKRSLNSSLQCRWLSGFSELELIPYDIRQAIYMLASHLFSYGGDAMNRASLGGSARSLEMINDPLKDSGALAMLGAYTRYAT